VSTKSKKLCRFTIRFLNRPALPLNMTAYALPQSAGSLLSFFFGILTKEFYESAQLDILIEADVLPSIFQRGTWPNICVPLLVQETTFGWILTGPAPSSTQNHISALSTQDSHAFDTIQDKPSVGRL